MFTTIIFFTIISLIFSNTDASPITGTRKSLFSLKTLEPIKLTSVSDNKSRTVPELVKKGRANSIVIFFTHFGDLSSMELAQQLKYYLPQIQKAKINVIGIGPGTVENAKEFCSLNNFPIDLLHVDETAICYTTLKFSRGFLPNANISPYLKLLPMLAGIGSPGTIPEVLRGYFGDREAPSAWIKESLRYSSSAIQQ